jgi:hypothetical protein
MSWRMRVLQGVAWCLGLRFTPVRVQPPSLPTWMDEDERPTVH